MDQNADTGRWIRTEVATPEVDEARKRLYTLANKAGYSLRTECEELTETDGDDDGMTLLRFQVRSKNKKGANRHGE